MAPDFNKVAKELTTTHFAFEGRINPVFTHFYGWEVREGVRIALEFSAEFYGKKKLIEDLVVAAKAAVPYMSTSNTTHREAQQRLSAVLKEWENT